MDYEWDRVDGYYNFGRVLGNDTDTLLITLGCSWNAGYTEGILASEDPGDDEYFPNCAPYRISRMTGCDVINLSKSGGSNKYMILAFNRFINEINSIKSRYKRVILMPLFTSMMRTCDREVTGPIDTILCLLEHGLANASKPTYNYYLHHADNSLKFEHELLETMYYLQNMAQLHGMEYYYAFAFEQPLLVGEKVELSPQFAYYYDLIDFDNDIMNGGKDRTFMDVCHHDKEKYFGICYHPSPDGYQMIAEYLIDKIKI